MFCFGTKFNLQFYMFSFLVDKNKLQWGPVVGICRCADFAHAHLVCGTMKSEIDGQNPKPHFLIKI